MEDHYIFVLEKDNDKKYIKKPENRVGRKTS